MNSSSSVFSVSSPSSSCRRSSPPVTYKGSGLDYEQPMFCKCNLKARQWIPWTNDNPGRRFYTCAKSQVSGDADFGRNLFERFSSLGHPKHLLDVQYRMHPRISKFPVSNFYDGKISDGPNVLRRNYERKHLAGQMYGSYSFIDIEPDERRRGRRGYPDCAKIVYRIS